MVARTLAAMEEATTPTAPVDVRGLMDELVRDIERYLDAVVLFRTLGCEPRWKREEGARGNVVDRIAPYVTFATP